MVRAVFLDRDGVINDAFVRDGLPYPPVRLEDFKIADGVQEACRSLKELGYILVVATNQPDVGRGHLERETVEAMHAVMCQCLPIDRVEVSYDSGENPSQFRKPAPGMLLRAAQDLNIDLSRSYMIGDRWKDIDCGAAAGCQTIFIDRSYREALRCPPDFRAANLIEASKIIVDKHATGQ